MISASGMVECIVICEPDYEKYLKFDNTKNDTRMWILLVKLSTYGAVTSNTNQQTKRFILPMEERKTESQCSPVRLDVPPAVLWRTLAARPQNVRGSKHYRI